MQSDRHNQLLNRLIKAARYNHPHARITTNQVPPHITDTRQRPDLVIVDEDRHQVFITDVTVTAQSTSNNNQATNGGTCLDHARQRKVDRYADIKRQYEEMGYSVDFDSICTWQCWCNTNNRSRHTNRRSYTPSSRATGSNSIPLSQRQRTSQPPATNADTVAINTQRRNRRTMH
ncbi:hypothetical protein O0I10_011583 [Lichtheimia ornata]|uniref:Restriction endonuclease domain-containing protein n=1 Tax=Lichtheimia ornata TaxID=688661 RepID=A0AAD7XWL8_9FUNG|nr:uncharacterized protein O0I10_011583 [Lichtheimia ornata]KAJ8652777.1 hypothetical protein O0I10_011583 [Lichtheimia ornata]